MAQHVAFFFLGNAVGRLNESAAVVTNLRNSESAPGPESADFFAVCLPTASNADDRNLQIFGPALVTRH